MYSSPCSFGDALAVMGVGKKLLQEKENKAKVKIIRNMGGSLGSLNGYSYPYYSSSAKSAYTPASIQVLQNI
jgi:hypothetical protein